jgi:hypothetical protein
VQDVAAASDASCLHDTVVPFPGGFDAPVFCIPALQFTVSVDQTGCGIGQIDSDGGSDFTVTEIGDTSAPNAPCNLPASCTNGANSNLRVDITVGDGVADTCAAGGTANAIVAIPVFTTTWQDQLFQCPDPDGAFDPGSDTLIVSFPQLCCIAGAGPASNTNPCNPGGAGGQTNTGVCLDLVADTITTAASGAVGSSGSPLFDLTFTTRLPNTITGPAAPLGATCASPPVIDFDDTATRCIP